MRITKSHTYGGGYISLPVPKPGGLPAAITFKDKTYYLKDEFHISLVCVKKLAPTVAGMPAKTAEEKILHLFKEYAKDHPLDSYDLTDDIRLVTKDVRQALVVMVNVEGLTGLFGFINERLGTDFGIQPAHITLYTLQPGEGIGILDSDELETIAATAEIPGLAELLGPH